MRAKWIVRGSCLSCLVASTSLAATSPVAVDAPAIDWASIGTQAPTSIAIGARAAGDPLPHADVVILTWTVSEWSALDHVFLHSSVARSPTDRTWESAWQSYTRNASSFTSQSPLWGSFQLVQVVDASKVPLRVLLFKSNAHLSFNPYIAGLRAMLQNILADTTPERIYSIGTAGAARTDQRLGDSVVTNAAFLDVTLAENTSDPDAGKTFTSPWYPSLALEPQARQLMIPLGQAATPQDLQTLFTSVFGSASGVAPGDVIDGALTNLGVPAVDSMQGVPLDSSDNFGTTPGAGMAPGDGNDPYAAYETDDAVVADVAIQAHVAYSSIRNVSDTVVPSTTADGGTIGDTLRTSWGSALYYRYGFLTSVNGAIATWATIAGSTGAGSDAGAGSGGAAGASGAAGSGGGAGASGGAGAAGNAGAAGAGDGSGAGGAAAAGAATDAGSVTDGGVGGEGGSTGGASPAGSSSGCSCRSTAGTAGDPAGSALVVALVGVALAVARRRPRSA